MSLIFLFLIFCTDSITVDPARPEGHREVIIVPFQDHVDNGVLHNGFGVEVVGADFRLFREGVYRAWLCTSNTIIVQLPTVCSTLIHHVANYTNERQRLGGHSETYEVARMVVRNRILANSARQHYNLEVVFPQEYELTNAVFSPGASPLGRIDAQVTPVLVPCQVSDTRTLTGIEIDLCFAVTIVEEEPCIATAPIGQNGEADQLNQMLQGMNFGP